MKATIEVETWEINGRDTSGVSNGPRPAVVVESNTLHTNRVRIKIGDATATVDATDMVRAIQAAAR